MQVALIQLGYLKWNPPPQEDGGTILLGLGVRVGQQAFLFWWNRWVPSRTGQ